MRLRGAVVSGLLEAGAVLESERLGVLGNVADRVVREARDVAGEDLDGYLNLGA